MTRTNDQTAADEIFDALLHIDSYISTGTISDLMATRAALHDALDAVDAYLDNQPAYLLEYAANEVVNRNAPA